MDILRVSQFVILSPSAFSYKSLVHFLFKLLQSYYLWRDDVVCWIPYMNTTI